MGVFDNIIAQYGMPWVIGQIFGIVAIIFGFVTYQMKSQSMVLMMQGVVALSFVIHYGLIGAYSGMAMNAICLIRTFVYDNRLRKNSQSDVIPIVFVIIQCVMCALTWEAWYSIFVLIGIGINTYCMSFYDPQKVRKSILVTSPMVIIYDFLAGSIGGVIYESVAIISSAVGIARTAKGKEKTDHDR